jgi:phage shock protein A
MSLRLFDRIATLLRADAHGIIESLEERSLLLKQCVREAEIELNQKRARLETLREEEKRLREAEQRCEAAISSLDEDISLALQAGKDDLARFSIRRLIPLRTELKGARAQIEQRNEEGRNLADRLAEQESKFERLRARVRVELSRAGDSTPTSISADQAAVADEEVELELMRRRKEGQGAT